MLSFPVDNVVPSGRKALIDNKGVIATEKEAPQNFNCLLPKMQTDLNIPNFNRYDPIKNQHQLYFETYCETKNNHL